jgi:DNA repair protein RecO (recombination protein O)
MPRPERVYRTEAVIMRRHDLGETDRILTLYSRDHGKIRAVAKGIRKPTSRKAGHLELFMQTDVLVARGRSLDIITQAETIDAFRPVRGDLIRTTYAAHFVELLDAFTGEADASPPLYALLVSGLAWIGVTGDLRRAARTYELRLLGGAGYRPELFHCVNCGKDIKPEDQFFSPSAGGVLCPSCGPSQAHTRPISLRALKVLRYLQTRSFEVIERLNLSREVHVEVERLLHWTLTYHLERRLKSADFLRRLRREAAASSQDNPVGGQDQPLT